LFIVYVLITVLAVVFNVKLSFVHID